MIDNLPEKQGLRLVLAAVAMHALIPDVSPEVKVEENRVARDAVKYADELLKVLGI